MLITYKPLPCGIYTPLPSADTESHSVCMELSAVGQVRTDGELLGPGAEMGAAVAQRNG